MLTDAVNTYLAIRRATGFALRCEGIQLKSFATCSEARGHQYISSDLAIEWAGLAQSVSQRARRLGTVIRFARYLRAEDPRHQVPSPIFGAEKLPRPTPYILTMEHIHQLIDAASRLGYRTLRRATYSTLFSLLACTGLRVSEAIRLRFDDITADGLVIRCTKFRKSRLVPVHETARAGLERYLHQRRPYAPPSTTTCSSRCAENRSCRPMWTRHSAQRRRTSGCRTDADTRGPRRTLCDTPSPSEPCKPARMAAMPSAVTWWRSRPTSVTATWPTRIGIWKPCRI